MGAQVVEVRGLQAQVPVDQAGVQAAQVRVAGLVLALALALVLVLVAAGRLGVQVHRVKMAKGRVEMVKGRVEMGKGEGIGKGMVEETIEGMGKVTMGMGIKDVETVKAEGIREDLVSEGDSEGEEVIGDLHLGLSRVRLLLMCEGNQSILQAVQACSIHRPECMLDNFD